MNQKEDRSVNVLICCGAGMSSSALVRRMRQYAQERGVEDFTIDSASEERVAFSSHNCDIVLLAPQVSFKEKEVRHKIGNDTPLVLIPMLDYGRANCENIFNLIEKTLGTSLTPTGSGANADENSGENEAANPDSSAGE